MNKWSDLGIAPVSYQGGTGVYHEETSSLRLLTGYPNYDTIFYLGPDLYTYGYYFESSSWNPSAPRHNEAILYQSSTILVSNEIALIHGGMAPENTTSCFQNILLSLDLG